MPWTIIAAVLGVVGTIAAAIAVARSAYVRTIVDLQAKEIDVYKGRVETLEQELDRVRTEYKQLNEEFVALKRAYSGAPQVAELRTYVDHRFDDAMRVIRRIEELVSHERHA